jgi:hypothetical protein
LVVSAWLVPLKYLYILNINPPIALCFSVYPEWESKEGVPEGIDQGGLKEGRLCTRG